MAERTIASNGTFAIEWASGLVDSEDSIRIPGNNSIWCPRNARELAASDHRQLLRRQGAPNRPESIRVQPGLGARGCSVLCGGVGFAKRLPSVGQQFLDPTGRMGADSIENVTEVSFRIDLQFLARRAQAHQHGRRLASLVAPHEQPVFPFMRTSA